MLKQVSCGVLIFIQALPALRAWLDTMRLFALRMERYGNAVLLGWQLMLLAEA